MIRLIEQEDLSLVLDHHGAQYSVSLGDKEPYDSYSYQSLIFRSPEQANRMSAGVYDILPGETTNPVLLLPENMVVEAANLSGDGYLLRITSENDVIRDDFASFQVMRTYFGGEVVCYIARATGLSVLEICEPPGTDDAEVVLEPNQRLVGDRYLNKDFWTMRRMLKGPTSI